MMPLPFSQVNTRKLSLQSNSTYQKISFRTVSDNLNASNLLLFFESNHEDYDHHYRMCLSLYDRYIHESEVSDINRRKLENALISNLIKVKDIKSISETITDIENPLFFVNLDKYENYDRILRNEARIAKRFDLQKTINENFMQGTRHSVFELCSLLDTYDISSKAKLNIALENIQYALFKSGHKIDLTEASDYIVEYFLTRNPIITDKQYEGYIHVLENNKFIDKDNTNLSYVFEAKNVEGNSFTDKAKKLIVQCETKQCSAHMSQILNIRNEKQASKYIDESVAMIMNEDVTINDSLLLLKSIYCLPLIGNISKEFVNYKLEMSRSKFKIKQKVANAENKKLIQSVLDDGSLLEFAEFISESLVFENNILDDHYVEETNPVKLLESENQDDNIKAIIDSFKASNEKSPSKFKNMMNRIMTKSPSNIINDTPNIFAAARVMMYLGIAAAFPLGPVFAAILAMVNKLITMHLDLKEAEKLLRHLKSEKEKAEKKLEKLSGKEKDNQKEYIDCLNKCIKKVSDFITKIDDENEEVFGGDDDDFNFDDDDFSFESAVLESGSIYNNSITDGIKELLSNSNIDMLACVSTLFDNCNSVIANEFYNFVENAMNEAEDKSEYSDIIKSKGTQRISEESSFIVEYEALSTLKEIIKEAKEEKKDKFNLNTLKMAVVNFKKKFRDLKGKEHELWKNIDIATASLTRGIQQALTSDRRETIIKGSIIPSFSKCIKFAISVGAVHIFIGPVGAAIAAVGMLGASKLLNERERRLLYDEIDTELQVVEKQIQLAENEGDMNQYRFLLNYQKKLTREKHRIKYGVHMSGRKIPEIKRGND